MLSNARTALAALVFFAAFVATGACHHKAGAASTVDAGAALVDAAGLDGGDREGFLHAATMDQARFGGQPVEWWGERLQKLKARGDTERYRLTLDRAKRNGLVFDEKTLEIGIDKRGMRR
jgi:hypothetical protein